MRLSGSFTTRFSLHRWLAVLCLLLVVSGIAACGWWNGGQSPSPTAQTTPQAMPSPTNTLIAQGVIIDMLNNIKENGYDPDTSINAGKGGLWINWRYGTRPLVTNLNGSGVSDSDSNGSLRHDPLTD